MIRYSLLFIAMIVVAAMASRNWYRGLCFMLPLLAVLERPDMPREMLGIGGVNPFNIMLGFVLVCWFVQRRRDGSRWQADPKISRLLVVYMLILAVSTFRAFLDLGSLNGAYAYIGRSTISSTTFFIEAVINTGKWLIPGMLIAVGANSKERVRLAVVGILLTGALLSLQVIAKMMPALIGGQDLADRALRVLDRDLGYHRVDLAAITASMAWAFLAAGPAFNRVIAPAVTIGGFLLCTLAMAATGGRAGMLSWIMCALALGFLKWRKILILVPVVAILALAVVPGLRDRVFEGFGEDDASAEQMERRASMGAIDESGRDRYAITSGRVVVWPMVIEQANKSPAVGFGREAMQRTGIVARLRDELNITSFGHPHNAYLQLYIDTGLVGIVFVGWFFWLLVRRSLKAFADPPDKTTFMVATMSLSFLIINLTAALGSQSFYPKQGATLFWIVIGLSLSQLMRRQPVPATPATPQRQLIR
ncbi:MAG: O-antigen ligase domain-containing protein [Chromatiales bacterium]|nr:MAG: O-antigen ligase domain-containing protein [Chromatiales bacterium]